MAQILTLKINYNPHQSSESLCDVRSWQGKVNKMVVKPIFWGIIKKIQILAPVHGLLACTISSSNFDM